MLQRVTDVVKRLCKIQSVCVINCVLYKDCIKHNLSVWCVSTVILSTIYRFNTIAAKITTALFLEFIKMTPKLETPKGKICVHWKGERGKNPFEEDIILTQIDS